MNRLRRFESGGGAVVVAMVMVLVTAAVANGEGGLLKTVLSDLTSPASAAGYQSQLEPSTQPQSEASSPTIVQPPAAAVQPTAGNTFEIHVQGADLRGVLQLLSTQGRRNIVATKEVSGTVTADLYAVTFTEALEAILRSNGFVYQEKDNFIYVYTPEQLAEVIQSERQMETKIFHLAYMTADDVRDLVEQFLSTDGIISITPAAGVGVPKSDDSTGGNSYATNDVLIVRDYEENIKRITGVVEELDVKPQQILIEVTMLSAKLDEDNSMGVNFNALAGIDFMGMGSTSSGVGNTTAGGLGGSTQQPVQVDRILGVSTNLTTVSNGLTVGFLSNNISVFITALEGITDTTVLANPKLLILNKQRGEVLIGSRDGYLTTTTTETAAIQTVQFLDTGPHLVVRPYIAKDGYIRLEIHPKDSDGGVSITDGLALPSETTTELTTNVLVRDGHTIVLGGLFREETIINRSQVPVLGNIPYLGTLFRFTKDVTERREIIILMTPHIIKQAEAEAVGERIKDDVERFRAGMRKGLRWWGSNRLARGHIRQAKQAMHLGRIDKALWHVDMALAMEWRMEEAIRLKERLTQQAYWSDEVRYSSVKYLIQQMIMQELGKADEDIIPPYKPRSPDDVDPAVREALGIGPRVERPLPGRPQPFIRQIVKDEAETADQDNVEQDDSPSAPAKGGEEDG